MSSSWNDTGVDDLTNGDEVAGETDTYSWADLNSVTDGLTETETFSETDSVLTLTAYIGTATYAGSGLDSLSLTDTGTESLSAQETDPASWILESETDQFDINDSLSDQNSYWDSATYGYTSSLSAGLTHSQSESIAYSIGDVGDDVISGTTSDSSDSYTLLNNSDFVTLATTSETEPNGSANDSLMTQYSLGFDADGTDSFGPGTAHQSTLSFDESGFTTSSYEGSMSFAIDGAYEDLQAEWSTDDYEPDNGSGWSTVSNASTTLYWDYSQSNTFEETENESWLPSYPGATASADLTIDDTLSETAVISGNSADGFDSILESTTTCYTLTSGALYGIGPDLPSTNLLPENATNGSLLQQVEVELTNSDVSVPRYSSGNLYLSDTYAGVYAVPHSVPALLSGSTANEGTAALGLHLAASSPNDAYGFTPYTNAQTPHGLPDEEANTASNLSQDNGPPTGGPQTSTASPTDLLQILSGAGRDPADITIPTQAGTQATGGPASSGSNLVVGTDASQQGPSMRAAPPQGFFASALEQG